MTVDFGTEVKDQIPALHDTLEGYHAHLADVAAFYAAQAEVEREFASQQRSLLRKAHEKRSKRVETLVAGAAPVKLFKDGDAAGREHTLDSAWARMLSATEEVAANHSQHADALDKLSTSIRSAEDRSSALLKSHQTWYTSFLVSERDRRDADRAKNKDKYDAACSSLESARQKQDSAKDPEKGERAYARALADMECAKDAYLASIQSNNRSQHMFFSRDLPAVHRHYQTLWTLIVSNLTDFLRRGCYATEAHLAKLKDVNDRVLEAVGRIDPDVDQKIYVDFNSKPFFPPADKTFEPCSLWHDTSDPVLSAAAKTYLQNLGSTSQKVLDAPNVLESREKEVETLANIVQTYSREPSLGNAMEVAENMLNAYRHSMELRLPRELAESDYDFSFDCLGGDMGSQRPHDFKTASFPKSHSCKACGESIWGIKGGMKCRACPVVVHAKCAHTIAATCAGVKAMQTRPRSMSSASSIMTSPGATPSPSQATFLQRSDTNATTRPTPTPTIAESIAPVAGPSKRTMGYDFQGSTELELDVSAGSQLTVINPDDHGWTKVRDDSSGREGLVPTAYLAPEEDGYDNNASSPTSTVPVKIGYEATESGEVTVEPGQQVELLDGAPEGWARVRTDHGREGLVPAWAVE